MKNLLIIDGNSIINRAFYGIRLLTNKHGLFTNAVYGFIKVLLKHMSSLEPDYICVAFDLKAPTFRHKMYDKYKAQRKGMPDELRVQMPVLKEVLCAMNIACIEKEGYEADDIIGTVSRMCDEQQIKCHILTGDRDDLQLASDTTDVLLTITKGGATTTEVYDAKRVAEQYLVTPTQFVDVKALMGDSSDNVPGVKGIGEKTAFSYIQKFKSIESLYENLDDPIIKPAARQKLEDDKEMAFLSKKLCTIDRYVPLEQGIESYEKKPYNTERLTELFINLEFNAFLKEIGEKKETENSLDLKTISADELSRLISDAGDALIYRLYGKKSIDGFAFKKDNTAYFCPSSGNEDEAQKIADAVKPIFESEKTLKISDDIKHDIVTLYGYGINYVSPYFDTGIGAYIINPSKSTYDISSVALDLLSVQIESCKEILSDGKKEIKIYDLPKDKLCSLITDELYALEELKAFEEEKIQKDGQSYLLYEIEMPLVRVLAKMEISGFKVDKDALSDFTCELGKKLGLLEESIYSLAGESFNINSTKQLGVILFEKLGLKAVKKTKTGYSTDSSVLEKLVGKHEIIEKLIEYRKFSKLKSTYGDGLLAVIDPDTHRIHTSFNQTVTTTGRISSTEPNLQNIPARSPEGREIRKMFVCEDDSYVLIDADYSQIELRILSHMANDETMTGAFLNGEDIHASTASKVFGVPQSEVTPLLRTRAKAVNFGIVYGMGDYSLSRDLGISVKEAREYIQSYFEKFANVKNYLDCAIEEAKEKGYVTTMFGRRRYIPEISSANFMTRSFGERVAMNTPIQGSAADIIKIAMVKVSDELEKRKLKSRLILQVHDELIIEASKDEKELVEELLCECMKNAAQLKCGLVADAASGYSWYEAH